VVVLLVSAVCQMRRQELDSRYRGMGIKVAVQVQISDEDEGVLTRLRSRALKFRCLMRRTSVLMMF
jgi:hypothetical protein